MSVVDTGPVRDLGILEGPVLLFGGPYSNLQATRALLAEAGRRAIPPGNMICTGDVVAYCADPVETVAAIMDAGIPVVMGNCEESLGAAAEDCGCGFDEGSSCEALSAAWYAYANQRMTPGQRAWMSGLPRAILVTVAGRRLAVLHGAASTINRFMFEAGGEHRFREEMSLLDRALERRGEQPVDGVVLGHSGVPFTTLVDDRLWHNAGVVGMPANDGTPRVWFSILQSDGDSLAIETHALRYDHEGAASAMDRARLPEGYARALRTGLWPDDSIMPEEGRAVRGREIATERLLWGPQVRNAAA